jgi:type IV pilus assembly protein PilE
MPLRTVHPLRSAGFTLIELMVVVVIASILLAVAVPAYLTYIRQARRTEAKTAILDLAGREERYFSTNGAAYTQTPAQIGLTGAGFPINVGNSYYQVTVCSPAAGGAAPCNDTTPPVAPSFQIVAVPVAANGQTRDAPCQIFGVDSTGKQWALDGAGNDTTPYCWTN